MTQAAQTPADRSARTTRGPLPRGWICLGLYALVTAPTGAWLWERWTQGIMYNGHGIVIPPLVAFLVYEQLRDEPRGEPQASAWGFLFLVPSLLLIALDSAIGTQLLAAVGLVGSLPGLALLLLGVERTRRLIFPLILAAFMLPIPAGFVAPLHLLLRHAATWGAFHLVPLFGIPIHAHETVLQLPHSTLFVADACSGFSTLYAALTTALVLAHWRRSLAWGAVLVAAALVLSLLCNTLRVTLLAILVHYRGVDLLATPAHEISGILTFGVVLVLLFALVGRGSVRKAPSA
ncbi:MAG: exosortase/archaeosortase family protein [Myxococcota bacterium]